MILSPNVSDWRGCSTLQYYRAPLQSYLSFCNTICVFTILQSLLVFLTFYNPILRFWCLKVSDWWGCSTLQYYRAPLQSYFYHFAVPSVFIYFTIWQSFLCFYHFAIPFCAFHHSAIPLVFLPFHSLHAWPCSWGYLLVLDIISKLSIYIKMKFSTCRNVDRVLPSISEHPRVFLLRYWTKVLIYISNIEIVHIDYFFFKNIIGIVSKSIPISISTTITYTSHTFSQKRSRGGET